MKTTAAAAVILASVIGSGCAQQPYVAPQSGNPVTTLKMINNTTVQAFFRTFDNTDCERGPGSGLMAIVQGEDETPAETTIRADRPFVFTVDGHTYGGVSMSCVVAGTFYPEPGAVYTMEYKFHRGCSLDVTKTVDGAPAPVAVNRRSETCLKYGD